MRLMHRRDMDMTVGTSWRLILEFSVPTAIGLLFQQLYNMVDTLVVGRFVGRNALAAVGTMGNAINMLVGFCAGLAAGASVIISQYYGSHDDEALSRTVHTTISLTFILGVLTTVLGLALVEPLLRIMSTPAEVTEDARLYLTIYFSGVSGLLIYNMGSGILRAVGDSQRPLLFLIFSALVNTAGDLLFVLAFRMGVAGVAWATILAQFLSALLILRTLMKEQKAYGVRWKQLCLDRSVLKRILYLGLPSGIQQGITSFSNVFVQSYINAFGAACMAGWSIYNKLDVFILIPVQSIALASTTFVGQNWGAGKRMRAREGIRRALTISVLITVILSLVMFAAAPQLVRLFTNDAETEEFAGRIIRLVCLFYFTLCFNQILGGALRGIGIATKPTIAMLTSFVVFRQIYLFITKLLHTGFEPVVLGYPAGWILCSLLLLLIYVRTDLYRASSDARAG